MSIGARIARLRGSTRGGDQAVILAGTVQNIAGLGVFVLATFAANVVISRSFGGGSSGAEALGVVTLATQLAFIGAAATRFGMDMAAVRRIAIEVGAERHGRVRGIGLRALAVAGVVSVVAALIVFAFAAPLAHEFSDEAGAKAAIQGAALALPFVALTFVALGSSRGLKIMRHTLYVQWVGQPLLWIALMVLAWQLSKTVGATVLAYAASWGVAAVAAWALWHRETVPLGSVDVEPGETRQLMRFGAPRAPAALLSQALFWTDYFVASAFVARGAVTAAELGVYSAAVRVGQVMVLFLTAVSYMFSPFVADLHARGERDRLDRLFKMLTRWTVAGTIPLLALLLVVPGPLLRVFGGATFAGGETQLRILLLGQTVNVAVGAVGFILIMVGRTGVDLAVYVASFLLDLVLALVLVPRLGTEGAAIAQTATIAVSNTLRLLLVWRFVRIQPFDRTYARLLVPAAACFAAMVGANALLTDSGWIAQVLGVAVAGSVVYLPILLLVGLTAPEERVIRRVLGRPVGGEALRVRPVRDDDRPWIRGLMRERWTGETMVVHDHVFEPAALDGFVAEEDGRRVGLLTYTVSDQACEIVSLDSLDVERGVGTALLDALLELGHARVRAVTTNDNVGAIAFYEHHGFRIVTVRQGAVDRARERKPSIPLVGRDGIEIHDEIELERGPSA
ncbi:MAG TPA: GNAT family N-acetyltransferase [Actinomycetota bacterium]|nr:GNAT family N-acetyltransferase [Actinomycetota bacterium]